MTETETRTDLQPHSGNEPPKKKSIKKGVFYALFILLCIGSLVVTAAMDFGKEEERVPFATVMRTLGENYIFLLCALGCFLLVLVFKGLKRAVLLNATVKRHNNVFLGIKSAAICKYYDCITPFGSGGQPMEIMYLRKHGIPTSVASGVKR